MFAVLYRPTPPGSDDGPIVQQISGTAETIKRSASVAGLGFVEVATARDDWDRVARVADGRVVPL